MIRDPDPTLITDPYLAALVRAIQTWRVRAVPDEALATVLLPNEIAILVSAYAWHDATIAVGEMWFDRPVRVTAKRLRGTAKEAVKLGILANGDEVIARMSKTTATIVEVSNSGELDRKRGSLASFLRHCVDYARNGDFETPLDAHLPK